MTRPASIPADLWEALPADLRPAIGAIVAGLEARIAALEARLNRTSANSSQPPSSDPPHVQPAPGRTPSGRKKGGQPGHKKHTRPPLPPDVVVDLKPETCGHCDHPLAGSDPAPDVHQVVEIPEVKPHVTEYRRHRLTCPHCSRVTGVSLPAGVRGGYGERVAAVCGLLTGAYRIGKRGVAQLLGDLFGVPISPAMVCKLQHRTAAALEPVHAEVLQHLAGKPANVDETGWREGKDRGGLWVAVTESVTGFVVRLSRGRKVLGELIPGRRGVLTTDRFSAYAHLPDDDRQLCWAHLRRDFQAMIDRDNAGRRIGEGLLLHADILLQRWKRVRDGTLTRNGFRRRYLPWLRAELRGLLDRGARSRCAATAAVARDLRAHEPALDTFAAVAGVEPTNHAAERALRHAVCWRKTSHGTDTPAGSRFVERVLTAAATCRQQGRNLLEFLTTAIHAARAGRPAPSLVPAGV
jgi:transposase